ncbi:sensor domain-containing diguanylate cyclase [Haploplasma axanthum]|uniref:Probable diguanylate cyclase AdrA n=1 Tax=Haploplasma axanthum TaxID=29552 RepID=A0A449BDX3_HAPAX|nr:sensor domain-containing diguanylate cyclase [Haploplasma axanthum]VEU80632.1 Probable diguanylate cyclase AdrA [Haploplasma axanthum]
MTLEGMLITVLIALINFSFIGILLFINLKNPNRYDGLRSWINSNFIRITGSILIATSEYIKENTIKTIVSFLGYFLLVSSLILVNKSIYKLVDKKSNIIWERPVNIIFLVLLILFGIVIKNDLFFTLVILIAQAFYTLWQIIIVNTNRTADDRNSWLSFTILQTMAIIVFICYVLFELLFNEFNITNFTGNHKGQNIIIKSLVIMSTLNSIGLLTRISNVAPKYVDSENKLFRTVINLTSNMIVVYDKETKVINYVNPHFTKKFKYRNFELLSKKRFDELFVTKDEYFKLKEEYYKGSNLIEYKTKMLTRDNKIIKCLISISLIPFNDTESYLASIVDITNTISQTEKYEFLASYDELTNLPNRRVLYEVFKKKKDAFKSFILIILDIDNFKEINDQYGHNIGDEVLKILGPKLDYINDDNDLVARYGGDEFIFLIDLNNNQTFDEIINKLLEVFKEPVIVNNERIKIDISLGVAEYPIDDDGFEGLLEKADIALYRAKKYDGDKVVVYNEKDEIETLI